MRKNKRKSLRKVSIKRTLLTIIMLFVPLVIKTVVHGEGKIDVDKSQLSMGVISIDFEEEEKEEYRLIISKEDKSVNYYLESGDLYPLAFGNGKYDIKVYEGVKGKTTFKRVFSEEISLSLKNKNDLFLQSIQNVQWDKDMGIIKQAKKMSKKVKTDQEKAEIIHNYIVKNIRYDDKKTKTVKSNYIPDIEQVIKNKKGICYDYASVYAAMLRSIGIPTKLIMGYNVDIKEYHAWNQVYLKDEEKWITVDTTYDASIYASNKRLPKKITKKNSDYSVAVFY